MENDNSNHQTQSDTNYSEVENAQVHSMIEEAQRIEGGGPPQKVDLQSLPKPIRMFGYFFIAMMIVMVVFAILSNYL
ncbi:hypothetical protein D3C76_1256880 [compost metagenome]